MSPLYKAAKELREAQKAYMADRGNEALGKIVGEKAIALDAALAQPEDTIANVAKVHNAWLVAMGWDKTTPLEQLAMITSEIGEAVNECRGKVLTPELGSELADIVLRTFGMSEQFGYDIQAEIFKKMEVNLKRGTRGRVK